MAFSVLSLIITPILLNAVVVLAYVGIIGFQFFWKTKHKTTRVLNKTTGRPVPFALIKVWLPGLNVIVRKSVADVSGKFYFLVPPGTYYLTIEEKLPDGTYHEILRTPPRVMKQGVIKEDFLV